MSDTDDLYHGLGADDLLDASGRSESAFLAGYDDAGYFSIIPVDVFDQEGERYIRVKYKQTAYVNLSKRQTREVQQRMERGR